MFHTQLTQNWKARIKIGDLHGQHERGEMAITEVAIHLADRLAKYRDEQFTEEADEWYELDDIIEWFRCDVSDVEDYDGTLEELYNWADEGKRLWLDFN